MELNQKDIDLLDRYFRNELTPEELAQLQSRRKEQEFGEAADSYLKTLEVVKEMGRNDLRSMLTSVMMNVESQGGYEKYKSSKSGGSASGAFTISLIVLITGIIVWLYFSGNLESHKLQQLIPDSETLDTVYHYKVTKDTVIVNSPDSIKGKTKRRVITDTVYIRTSGLKSLFQSDSITQRELKWKVDSVIKKKNQTSNDSVTIYR